METYSALLALCAGNSPVSGELPAQRPVTRSFDAFLGLHLINLLSKHSRGWWFETLSHLLWRHCNGTEVSKREFLHDRPWISPWIKSISNELDITCHVFVSQLHGHCDVIANPLWRHQQNVKRARETRGWCVKILVLVSLMDSLCRVRNEIMYVLLWRTVYALTRVLFWCLFPSLLRNSGNKHQNNPLVSA